MNDIEILENKLKLNKKTKFDWFGEKEFEAIENLKKENTELRIQISARETVADELEKENKKLKERLKNVKNYIENEMDIVDNPTICGDEEDTITELPISLNLYNEDLRELLELLED